MVIVIVSVSWGRWPSGDWRECQLVGCGLWVGGCGLRPAGCGLWVVGCRLGAAAWGLRLGGCGLWVVGCRLRVVGCRLGAAACGLRPAVRGSGSRLSPVLARQPTSCTTANSWPSSTAANSGATTPMPCACASDATRCDFEPIACTGSTQRERA